MKEREGSGVRRGVMVGVVDVADVVVGGLQESQSGLILGDILCETVGEDLAWVWSLPPVLLLLPVDLHVSVAAFNLVKHLSTLFAREVCSQ